MMPTYAGVDQRMQRAAADMYRRLLPGWEVQGLDCTQLIRMGGAIHCVTLNLPEANPAKNRRPQANQQPAPISPRFPAVDQEPIDRTEQDDAAFMFGSEHSSDPIAYQARPFEADELNRPRLDFERRQRLLFPETRQ
jgi:hypothetical protein